MSNRVEINYYSDILCIWAHIAQVRVDEIQHEFGSQVAIQHHFFPLFGDTESRLGEGWKDKGGYDGFRAHVESVCAPHSHITLHPNVWRAGCRPASSALPHLIIQAVQVLVLKGQLTARTDPQGKTVVEQLICAIRKAFFEQGRNIGLISVLWDIVQSMQIDRIAVQAVLDDGTALAQHSSQNDMRYTLKLEGSPTFILDNGRQRLYGNVGYKVIKANIEQLLHQQSSQMSWC